MERAVALLVAAAGASGRHAPRGSGTGGSTMHWFRVVAVLQSLEMAAMDHPACGRESGVAAGPQLFRVRIEGGSAAVISSPSSFELTTGWKQPCVLELENQDAGRREVSLVAAPPVRIILPEARIVLEPNQTKAVTFLMQTLTLDEHEARLTVRGGVQECAIRVRIKPRPAPSGVRFGVLDHFELEGPIAALSVASPKRTPGAAKPSKPPFGGAGMPPKPQAGGEKADRRPEKDLSHLTVAPTGPVAERVLEAMRPIQDLGSQMYRMDISWMIVEHSPDVFSWDRMDWMTNAIRSPSGAGSRLVAQIGYQPQWLPPDFPMTSEGRQQYSRWVEKVVSRYADRVDYWEIWNEPLLFWLRHPDYKPDKDRTPQKPLSAPETDALAASFAQMILEVVRTASEIIRQRDPRATVLSPGFEDFFNAPGSVFPDFAREVYTRLLSDGMAQYVDGFCIHSYPVGFPGKAPPLDDTQAWRRFDQAADAGRPVRFLAKHNVHLPLYCTEFGGFRLPRKASAEAETAAALALLRNGCILAHQGFRLVTYFELYDWADQAMTYLMRYKDRHRTNGYSAYRKLIAALTGATACEVRQIPQARIHDSDYSGLVIKAFCRGSEDVLCLWNNAAAPQTVQLRVKPPAAGDGPIFEHVRFAPAEPFLTEKTWASAETEARDIKLTVAPLEFHMLSRTSSICGFDWLTEADVRAVRQ